MTNKISTQQLFQNISIINHQNNVNISFSVENLLINDYQYIVNAKNKCKKNQGQLKNKNLNGVKSNKNLQSTPKAYKKQNLLVKKKDIDKKDMFIDSLEDKQTKDSYQIGQILKCKENEFLTQTRTKNKEEKDVLISNKMISNKFQPSIKNRDRMKSIGVLKNSPKEQVLNKHGFTGKRVDSLISLKTLSCNHSAKGRSQTLLLNNDIKIKNENIVRNNYFDVNQPVQTPKMDKNLKKRTNSSSKKINLANKLSKKHLNLKQIKNQNLKSPRPPKK